MVARAMQETGRRYPLADDRFRKSENYSVLSLQFRTSEIGDSASGYRRPSVQFAVRGSESFYRYRRYRRVLSRKLNASRISRSITASGSSPRSSASRTRGDPNRRSNERLLIVSALPDVFAIAQRSVAPTRAD